MLRVIWVGYKPYTVIVFRKSYCLESNFNETKLNSQISQASAKHDVTRVNARVEDIRAEWEIDLVSQLVSMCDALGIRLNSLNYN